MLIQVLAVRVALSALCLLANPKAPAQLGDDPLTAEVTFRDDGIHVDLSNAAKDRVLKHGKAQKSIAALTLSTSRRVFEADPRPHLRQHLLELTGLNVRELLDEGGIRLSNASTGRLVWEWPSRHAFAQ